uniref:uncharacterized protein LOC120347801 isoform X2 n=1 Tax=Styela clava TaxID=7725 RepID=UPI00193A8F85|nr:uncharacterized protein LOC120347801 isoform X2 [Styela clava]
MMEEPEPDSVPPSVVGVKETTTPSVVGAEETTTLSVVDVKETTTPSVVGVKETTTLSVVDVKETTTPSVVGVKETTTPSVVDVKKTTTAQGNKVKKTSLSYTSTALATYPWLTKEAFLSTVYLQTTKVGQSTECGVVYNSKCFRVYNVHNVSLSVAESICGNKLANIYGVTHYNMVRDYLRSMILDELSYIYVRTGMTYNHLNGELNSTTGQTISLPTEVWYPNYPSSYASDTTVIIRVDRNPTNSHQGILNVHPYSVSHGAICENEL